MVKSAISCFYYVNYFLFSFMSNENKSLHLQRRLIGDEAAIRSELSHTISKSPTSLDGVVFTSGVWRSDADDY